MSLWKAHKETHGKLMAPASCFYCRPCPEPTKKYLEKTTINFKKRGSAKKAAIEEGVWTHADKLEVRKQARLIWRELWLRKTGWKKKD